MSNPAKPAAAIISFNVPRIRCARFMAKPPFGCVFLAPSTKLAPCLNQPKMIFRSTRCAARSDCRKSTAHAELCPHGSPGSVGRSADRVSHVTRPAHWLCRTARTKLCRPPAQAEHSAAEPLPRASERDPHGLRRHHLRSRRGLGRGRLCLLFCWRRLLRPRQSS